MGERKLRRRCRRPLNQLDTRPPPDVAELCRRVGEQRLVALSQALQKA